LADLDSDQFRVRQAAEQKLRALGELAESALRAALKAGPSLERRRRIEAVLTILDPTGTVHGELLRELRAVQVLERIGSPEARRVLEALAQGVESARLTRAAKGAVTRLARR